jgi:hypothetical protein
MKTDRSGLPDVSARVSPSAPAAASSKKPLARGIFVASAIVVLLALFLFTARHRLLEIVVTQGLGIVTGDRITVGAFALGSARSAFNDVRVTTKAGDPLLDVRHLDVKYSLRDLLLGRTHRYGLSALAVDGAVVSLVRHADGSYNIGSSRAGGAGARSSAAPWNLDVRVANSEIRLIDRAPVAPDLAEQRLTALTLTAEVRPERSRAAGSAQLLGRETAPAALRSWPLELRGRVDYPRGVAMLKIAAPAVPARGLIGFLQHGAAIRVDGGLLRHLEITVFALDIAPERPLQLHVGGGTDVIGGRLRVAALRRPVRDVRGRITLVDDGLWATRLDASLAGVSIVARGGAFDRQSPTLQLGLRGAGDLRDLRRAFAFSQNQPVRGSVDVQTLLEAPTSNLLVRSALHVRRGAYGSVPLADVSGRVDYHAGAVVLDGVRGRYGTAAVNVGARFVLGGPALDSAIAVAASAPGRTIPFAENIAPEATVDALALISGGVAGYRARGALGVAGSGVNGAGTFAVDERGVGEFGPLAIARRDGSSLIGALRLERPISRSAAWLSARDYRVAVPAVPSRFAGLNVPAFPPVAGVLDGEIAGGGAPSEFALTGDLRGRQLRLGAARLGTGSVRFGGTLSDVRLAGLSVDGPLGSFVGSAAAARGAFALRGAYRGSLERLVPLTGPQDAHGAVGGDVLATLAGTNVVVQSSHAALHGGSVRGVALDAAAGTIAVRNSQFHLLVGAGSIAGRQAVAVESRGSVALSAPDIPAAALRGTGLPLEAGNVSAYGLADLRGKSPKFGGTVTVAGGRAHGYGITGDARIDLVDQQARILEATGALGSTYGSIGGAIRGFGAGALRYDLAARVPLGDVDLLRRDLGLPVHHLTGSFSAGLHVHGSGTRPFVDGRVLAPEGIYNGLAFRDAGAQIALDADGIAARDGRLTVGSTKAELAAMVAGRAFRVALRSPATDLADFNDYFDASDTLGGRGSIALTLSAGRNLITTEGALDLSGLRYRDFPLGRTTADWHMQGASIAGRAAIRDPAGSLEGSVLITPARDREPLASLRAARYAAHATLSHVDLGTWVPAAGSNAPILGQAAAQITVAGRLPDLTVTADAALTNATIAGYAVSDARLRARSSGSRVDVLASSVNLGFAQLAGTGRLGLAPNDPLSFDLRLNTDDISLAARAFMPAARGLDLAGALDADVRLNGTRAHPRIEGGFDLRGARYGNFVVPRTIGALALAGRAVELRDVDVEFARGVAFVAGSLPLTVQPFGLGPPRAPLSFDVTARDVDLAQFSPLLPAGTKLGGTVDGRFGVEGTVDRPRLLGSLSVLGGSYTSPFERTPITNLGAQLAFSGSGIALQTFRRRRRRHPRRERPHHSADRERAARSVPGRREREGGEAGFSGVRPRNDRRRSAGKRQRHLPRDQRRYRPARGGDSGIRRLRHGPRRDRCRRRRARA